MTQWRKMTAAEGAAAGKRMQDTGKSLYELRRGRGGRSGSAYKMKQRFSCGRRRRAGDWFILGRLCRSPSLLILFFFLLLCSAVSVSASSSVRLVKQI